MLRACVILNLHIVLHLTIVFACPSDVFEMDLHWKSLTILSSLAFNFFLYRTVRILCAYITEEIVVLCYLIALQLKVTSMFESVSS